MHNVHNEYILLLCEAAEFERDMRTILLPGLLEHQQAIHEDATDRWKMILQDIYRSVSQFWYLTKRYFMFGILLVHVVIGSVLRINIKQCRQTTSAYARNEHGWNF